MTTRGRAGSRWTFAFIAACWLLAVPLSGRSAARVAHPAPTTTWHAYQRNHYFQQLNGRNGLAQNSVSLIFQDHAGFMWFATQGGLFRYDGYQLDRFTHDPNRVDSLPDDYQVTALADAGAGRLWVSSARAGLVMFDPATNQTTALPKGVEQAGSPIRSLLRRPDGKLLVGTDDGVDLVTGSGAPLARKSLWREAAGSRAQTASMTQCSDGKVYAAASDTLVELKPDQVGGDVLVQARNPIQALACDRQGRLLVGTATGLWAVDRAHRRLDPVWHASPGVGVAAIAIDHANRLWLGLDDHSLLRMTGRGSITRINPAPLGTSGGLPDSRIQAMFIDRTGMLWVGTLSAGVVWTRTDDSPVDAVLNLNRDPRALTFVHAFQAAGDGQYWVAASGAGLVRYDPASQRVTSYQRALDAAVRVRATHPPNGRPFDPAANVQDLMVSGIVRNADGDLLLSTRSGILRFNPGTGAAARLHLDGRPDSAPTRTLLRARNGDLWVARYARGVVHYRGDREVQHFASAQGLAADDVMVLSEDHAGNIWAGTTNGASVIDPATGKVRTFREIPGDPHSLAGRTIVSLLLDGSNHMWFGSLSGISRLAHLDVHGATFKRYGLADGLPDTTIDCMLEDARGRIWFSTNLGLGRLDPKTGAVRSLGLADGIQGDEYNARACLHTANDTLLFGGHGFDIVDPSRLPSSAADAPVVITAIDTSSGEIPVPDTPSTVVSLDPQARNIYVAFSTLDYAAAAHNRFRYRLLGSRHPDWNGPTLLHRAAYVDIAPGSYRLEIQSVLRNGEPGRSTALRFRVPEVWWWSVPMRAVYAVAMALLILIVLFGWRSHHLEQVRHRRQLALRENRLRQALWGSGDEFWDLDLEHGTILRLGPEGGPGGHHEESMAVEAFRATMVHPDDLASLNHALAEHLAGKSEHFEVEHRVRGRDDEWTWVVSRGRIVERDANGKPLRICGTERDISALRAADRERRIAAEVIHNMSEAVAVTTIDYRFVSINAAFTRTTGYTEQEVIGHDAALLNGSRHAPESYDNLRQSIAETGHWRGELWQRRKDGEEFLCWVEINEVCDASGQRTHMICVLTDITDRKRAEQELRYLANYDTLTGLPNRALLGERLGSAVISARRSGQKVGVLFLDLDRFKHINDSLGHDTGDRTLKAAGARLRQCVRETDVVARLGGDEFTVILENLTDLHGAEEMAQRLIQAFARPLPISGSQETVISPSIGIAIYPDHGQTPAELLKCADTAMYQAKDGGRNTWAVYHQGMDTRARDHATMVTAMRRAIDRSELSIVYQPKLDIRGTQGITGMEALLRWHSPELGEIPPSVFIPLAEETGQIHEISAYVFGVACADLRRFREAGHRNLVMAINLSAAQLTRPDLTLHICDMLAEHDVAPNQVELELTESMVMANAEQSVRVLGELKSIGARLAIDDFGTGYSSLAYLKRLPIDTLKIDQTFVGDITTDPDDAAITSTIITLAHSLQLRVVAEGVETPEQLAFLRAQHCDEIQGFWLSQPLSADACIEFLDQRAEAAPHAV